MSKRMVANLMLKVSFYVNAFPFKSVVSFCVCPMAIMEGVKLDYNKHLKVIPGKYGQTFEGSDNTLKEPTIRAIALGPLENLLRDVQFFSLKTALIIDQTVMIS